VRTSGYSKEVYTVVLLIGLQAAPRKQLVKREQKRSQNDIWGPREIQSWSQKVQFRIHMAAGPYGTGTRELAAATNRTGTFYIDLVMYK